MEEKTKGMWQKFFEKLTIILALLYAWRDRKRILLGMQSDMHSQTLYKAAPLMPGIDPERRLRESSRFVAQALNLFLIGPLDSEDAARQQIELALSSNTVDGFQLDIYKMTHDASFSPSEFVASVAFLLFEINIYLFNHKINSEKELSHNLKEVINEASHEIAERYPLISKQFYAFIVYFKMRYVSPWDTRRYSGKQTSANFGTGVDYITM